MTGDHVPATPEMLAELDELIVLACDQALTDQQVAGSRSSSSAVRKLVCTTSRWCTFTQACCAGSATAIIPAPPSRSNAS